VFGAARLSPDSQYIAIGQLPRLVTRDPDGLTIFDRRGNLIRRFIDDEGGIVGSWDWLPDGRLLIVKGHGLDVANHLVGEGLQLIREFPGQFPGFVAVSPNGGQVAFVLGNRNGGSPSNHVCVMNMDGTDFRQLTTSNKNEDGAAWSPDGKYIAVRHDIVYDGNNSVVICNPDLFVVPAAV